MLGLITLTEPLKRLSYWQIVDDPTHYRLLGQNQGYARRLPQAQVHALPLYHPCILQSDLDKFGSLRVLLYSDETNPKIRLCNLLYLAPIGSAERVARASSAIGFG